MTSSRRNHDYDTAFQRPYRGSMRTGYVLVSEERVSGSEYSGSTCCCSSCASSCSCSESGGDDEEEDEEDEEEGEGEEEEDDDDEEDAYLSDCSTCWARRNASHRRRAGEREGRRAEGSEQTRQGHDNHHGCRHGQHRHGGARQRGNSYRNSSSNNNNNANANTSTATPAYRSLAERILATTRRLRQDDENLHYFRTWVRVLDDLQRRSQTNPGNRNATSTAARTGQGSSSAATAVERASNSSSRAAAAAQEAARQTPVYSGGGRRYFMSGARSISANRRRRL